MATEKKKTIVQAVSEVLRAAGHPMTATEIYEAIAKADLYRFNTNNPVQIVRAQIRRHCVGIDLPKAPRGKYFQESPDGKYDIA